MKFNTTYLKGALETHLKEIQAKPIQLVVVFTVYLATAMFSLFMYRVVGTSPYLVIAPVGISLAALILEGYAIWPAIALAALVNGLLAGAAPLMLVVSVVGNTLQPVLGKFLLDAFKFDKQFFNLRDMFAFVFTALTTTTIVPTLTSLTIISTNVLTGTTRPEYWLSWWIGGALSALVLTPFLVRWVYRPMVHLPVARAAEVFASLAVVVVTSTFVFWTPYTTYSGISLAYALIAGLFWVSFRGGVRFTTLALFLMTTLSLSGIIFGEHLPTVRTLEEQIFSVQVFDLLMVFFFFTMVSIEEQRANAARLLVERSKKLEEAVARVNAADTAKNEFIALLGHELRNPLATLLSSVELMQLSDPPRDERSKMLDTMTERIRAMAYLLEDILDISRIAQRKFTFKKETVAMRDIAERVVAAVEPVMQKQGHRFATHFPKEEILVDADPLRVEQVMINILNNAAKYTPPGGRVEFGYKYTDGAVLLRVKDTGIGIAPELQERIFEPFMQAAQKTAQGGGIGVGLSLAKGLIELHKGAITVESAGEGRGSEFTVRLPSARVAPAAPMKTVRKILERPKKKHGLRVLVVDDNEDAAQGISRLLTIKGYDISTAYRGSEALEKAASYMPQVVLLDIGLPDMNGYEVARALRAQGSTSVIVALTGYGQDEDKRKAEEAGFDFHLTKPVGLAEIEPVLAAIAEKNEQLQKA